MSRASKRTSLAGLAITMMVAAALFALRLRPAAAAADQPKPAGQPPAAAVPTAGKERFFELRVYTAAPGKMEALNKRFRDHTLRLFEKHGIQNVGYWTAVDEKNAGKLYYVIAYPDKESRDKMLMNGIARDPEFLKAVAESEKGGKLTDGIESVLMTPTDYSPVK